MGLFKVTAPKARNFSNEMSQILGQYGAAAGAQYQDAATYDPMYQKLALELFGQAVPSINSALNAANTGTRTASTNDLASLGPQFAQGIKGINPGQTQIYDALVKSAQSQLAAGNRLTPNQTYGATNPVRADWAARGFSSDTLPAQLDEAVSLSRTGDNVQQQREGFAAGVANMGNEMYTRPTLASILGTGSQAGNMALGGAAGSGSPDTFGGILGYGSDLFNTNYNAEAAAKIATGNNRINAINGMTSAMTSY